MKEKIVIVGGGGHAKVIIDAIVSRNKLDIAGIVDPSLPKGFKVIGVSVLGNDSLLKQIFKKGIRKAFIGVGSVGDCRIRQKIAKNLHTLGFTLPVILHPQAIVSTDVKLGNGTFVAAGAVINPGTCIGENVIINTAASVDHDCCLGDFVHVAPGAHLSGEVTVGSNTHIGTGTNIVQCITIAKNCFIGAGITVTENIKENTRRTLQRK